MHDSGQIIPRAIFERLHLGVAVLCLNLFFFYRQHIISMISLKYLPSLCATQQKAYGIFTCKVKRFCIRPKINSNKAVPVAFTQESDTK